MPRCNPQALYLAPRTVNFGQKCDPWPSYLEEAIPSVDSSFCDLSWLQMAARCRWWGRGSVTRCPSGRQRAEPLRACTGSHTAARAVGDLQDRQQTGNPLQGTVIFFMWVLEPWSSSKQGLLVVNMCWLHITSLPEPSKPEHKVLVSFFRSFKTNQVRRLFVILSFIKSYF